MAGPRSPRACSREVVRRHNALRTTFADDAGRPTRDFHEPRVELERRDLATKRDPSRLPQGSRCMVSIPFDLERGPLSCSLLARLADDDHVLELVFDHIICDGWSHVVILDELAKLYDDLRRGADPRLPPRGAVRRPRTAGARAPDRCRHRGGLAYWRERLAGIPATLDLPTDRPRLPRPSFNGGNTPKPSARGGARRRSAPSPEPEVPTLFTTLAGRLRRPAAPILRPADHRCRVDVRGPGPAGAERRRRPLREHCRPAGRPRRRALLSATVVSGRQHACSSRWLTRISLRAARRRPRAGARREPPSDLPGVLRPRPLLPSR